MRIWLVSSVCLMTLALLISTSRSGLIGADGRIRDQHGSRQARHRRRSPRWTIFQGVLLAIVGVSFANFDSLMERFDETLRARRQRDAAESAIWADAQRGFPGFRDHRAPALARSAPAIAFTRPRNRDTLSAKLTTTICNWPPKAARWRCCRLRSQHGFSVALVGRRLKAGPDLELPDAGGRVAGLRGGLVQSFWETGLRMPANAMLFAVLAAIATSHA